MCTYLCTYLFRGSATVLPQNIRIGTTAACNIYVKAGVRKIQTAPRWVWSRPANLWGGENNRPIIISLWSKICTLRNRLQAYRFKVNTTELLDYLLFFHGVNMHFDHFVGVLLRSIGLSLNDISHYVFRFSRPICLDLWKLYAYSIRFKY